MVELLIFGLIKQCVFLADAYHQPKSYKCWLKQIRAVVVTSKELMKTGGITLLTNAAAGAAALDVSHSDVGLTSKQHSHH